MAPVGATIEPLSKYDRFQVSGFGCQDHLSNLNLKVAMANFPNPPKSVADKNLGCLSFYNKKS